MPALGQTAQDALKVVPEKAAGFVIVGNLGEFNNKIETLAKRLGAPLPFSPLEHIKGELGIDKGLNTKGSLLFVILAAKGERVHPIPLLYVPVTDYQQLLQGLHPKADGDIATVQLAKGTKEMIVGRKGSFAVLTEPPFKEALKEALQATTAGEEALAPVQPRLVENDITGVLTTRGIKLLAEKAREGLAQSKNLPLGPAEAQFMLGWFDAADSFFKSVESDVTHLIVGSRLDKAGNMEVSTGAIFARGSSLAKAGAKVKASERGPLAGLPNVPFMFALDGPLSGDLMAEMMNFGIKIVAAMAKDATAEKIKKLEQVAGQIFKGLRSFSMVVGVGKDKESLLQNSSVVMKVKDAKAYFKSYEEYLEVYSSLAKDIKFPGFPHQSMQSKRTKVDGLPALEVTADFGGADNQNEFLKKMTEIYFGPEGKMVMTTVAIDNNTLLMRYRPADAFQEFRKPFKDRSAGLAQNEEIAKTIELLPEGSQWTVFISPRGSMATVNRFMAAVLPPGARDSRLPEFPRTPAVGFGVKISATGLDSRLVIPAAVLENVGRMWFSLAAGPVTR
jgi:hypothetical protein